MGLFKKSNSYFKVLNRENYASIIEAVQNKFGLTSANEAANHIFHKGVEVLESETQAPEPKSEMLKAERFAKVVSFAVSDVLADRLAKLEERLQVNVQQDTLEKIVAQIGDTFAKHLSGIEERLAKPTEETVEENIPVDETVTEVEELAEERLEEPTEDTVEEPAEEVQPSRKGVHIPLGFISTSFTKKGNLQRITLPARMTRDLYKRGYVGYKIHRKEDGAHILSFTKRRNMKTYRNIGYYADNNLANLCFKKNESIHLDLVPQNYLKLGTQREIGEVLRIHVEPTV